MGMVPNLIEYGKIIGGIAPVDLAGGTASSDWVNISTAEVTHFVFYQGVAGNSTDITFDQATDNAGSGTKTLGFTVIEVATQQSTDTWTETAVTSDTHASGTTNETMGVVTFRPEDLDINNGFTYAQMDLSAAAANLVCCIIIQVGNRYVSSAPPTAL